MSGSGPRRRGRRLRALLVVLLVVGALGLGEWRYGVGRAWLDERGVALPDLTLPWDSPDPLTEPAAVPPPETLSLPELPAPSAVADPAQGALPRAGRVRRAVAPRLGDEDLGRHVVATVEGLDGTALLRSGSGPFVPASTTKLLTATAALSLLGPGHTFTTRVLADPSGTRITLVGGGDPYLASKPADAGEQTYPVRADIVSLAESAAASLEERGLSAVRLDYDDSLFSGPDGSDAWRGDYLSDDIVSPISALWVDEGREPTGDGRVDDPARVAADTFARALTAAGVRVRGAVRPRAPAGTATEIAAVSSAPLAQIVERVLDVSDNEAAEVLGHQIGLASGRQGSFEAGADGVLSTLAGLGVATDRAVLHDGSGLSRRNRLTTRTLLDVLRVAASPEHPELRAVVTGLAVAGFTGSLTDRFADAPVEGRGTVRAKTGTLTGVSVLAGLATDPDGATMAFVFAADQVPYADTLGARDALDDAAAALAAPGG